MICRFNWIDREELSRTDFLSGIYRAAWNRKGSFNNPEVKLSHVVYIHRLLSVVITLSTITADSFYVINRLSKNVEYESSRVNKVIVSLCFNFLTFLSLVFATMANATSQMYCCQQTVACPYAV